MVCMDSFYIHHCGRTSGPEYFSDHAQRIPRRLFLFFTSVFWRLVSRALHCLHSFSRGTAHARHGFGHCHICQAILERPGAAM